MTIYLCNPVTGSVDTEEGWLEDYQAIAASERVDVWGSEDFDGAGLYEVVRNEDGEWEEAEEYAFRKEIEDANS